MKAKPKQYIRVTSEVFVEIRADATPEEIREMVWGNAVGWRNNCHSIAHLAYEDRRGEERILRQAPDAMTVPARAAVLRHIDEKHKLPLDTHTPTLFLIQNFAQPTGERVGYVEQWELNSLGELEIGYPETDDKGDDIPEGGAS